MRAEFNAFKAHLSARPVLATAVHDGAVRNADGSVKRLTTAHVLLFGGSPDALGDDRMTAVQRADSTAEYVYTARSVATTADGARATAAEVLKQLVGATLTIAGRRADPIRHTFGREIDVDASIAPVLFFIDDEYTLVTHPA